MKLFAEIIILLVIITLADIGRLKKHSLTGLHNLPKAIQERVRELPEYRRQGKRSDTYNKAENSKYLSS